MALHCWSQFRKLRHSWYGPPHSRVWSETRHILTFVPHDNRDEALHLLLPRTLRDSSLQDTIDIVACGCTRFTSRTSNGLQYYGDGSKNGAQSSASRTIQASRSKLTMQTLLSVSGRASVAKTWKITSPNGHLLAVQPYSVFSAGAGAVHLFIMSMEIPLWWSMLNNGESIMIIDYLFQTIMVFDGPSALDCPSGQPHARQELFLLSTAGRRFY